MSVNHYLSFLFRLNEERPDKLTDEQLLAKIQDEFKIYPGLIRRLSLQFLSKQRAHYNTGYLRGGIPKSPSFRYSPEGVILTAQGNVMSQAKIKSFLRKHKEKFTSANKDG